MPSNPLIHLCRCECGFCCCRGYQPQAVVTGAEAPCEAVNTTYSVNDPFFCELCLGPWPCTWSIGAGEGRYVVIEYAPKAYFPLVPDEDRWQLQVSFSPTGSFLTSEYPSFLTCTVSDVAGKHVLFGTNILNGFGDCAGQEVEITIS